MGLCPTDKTIGYDGLVSSETVHFVGNALLNRIYLQKNLSEQNEDIRSQ